MDVKLEGRHQDVVQGLWAALASQKQVKAGLGRGGDHSVSGRKQRLKGLAGLLQRGPRGGKGGRALHKGLKEHPLWFAMEVQLREATHGKGPRREHSQAPTPHPGPQLGLTWA